MVINTAKVAGYLISALLLVNLSGVQALTVDEFEDDQAVSAGTSGTIETSRTDAITPQAKTTLGEAGLSSAIGGTRKLSVRSISGNQNIQTRLSIGLGGINHSQDVGAKGESRIIWDGDKAGIANTSPNVLINKTGLGGIDFTQDGSDSFVLDVESFDYPFGQSVVIELVVYTNGNSASVQTLTINKQVTDESFMFPYSAFTKLNEVGVNALANFNKVGAIELKIKGSDRDIDLRIESLSTNQCPFIPNSAGKVVDECLVCNGDNTSCADCLGEPNGPAVAGTSCENGLSGVCAGGTFTDSCSCKQNVEKSPEACDGLDNNCNGQTDEAFPQLDQSCGIGEGVCQFTGTFVCNDNQSGLKCDGADALQNLADQCEESKGCDDVPGSGLVVDQCGVCGGDNSSCTDCKGVVFGPSVEDRCGVCEGDGTSCLGCSDNDQTATLAALDLGAKVQEKLIKKITRQILKNDSSSSRTKRFVKKTRAAAYVLQDANWITSWQFPYVTTTCGNTAFCVNNSVQSIADTYEIGSLALQRLANKALRKLSKVDPGNRRIKKFAGKNKGLHNKNMELLNSVPKVQSSCN